MFGLFNSPKVVDAELGELVRSRGYWRGTISVGESVASVPLAVAGSRAGPDPAALAVARDVAARFPGWRPDIERSLHEHLQPYAQSIAAGEGPPSSEPLARLSSPSEVWPHVSIAFVSVACLGGSLTTELGLIVAWDEEHTLGARFQDGKFVELCGSTLIP
jgi:hypothetical protein